MRVCAVSVYDKYGSEFQYLHNNAAPIQAMVGVNHKYRKAGGDFAKVTKIVISFVEKEEKE